MSVNVYEVVKQICLDELRAKGYAPNPADVHGIATQVAALALEEVEKAVAEVKASQPSTFPSAVVPTPETKVTPPTP